ncbi:MAG: hypothetical protein DMG93_21820 [Acidobacteria bacterium]|nr:MAG: hypothetical protein DMG93_21820 [Acidobacteriota bacterium]
MQPVTAIRTEALPRVSFGADANTTAVVSAIASLRLPFAFFPERYGHLSALCRRASKNSPASRKAETQQFESPYCVKIETDTGQSATVPIAVLTPQQLEVFLQSDFKRLAHEAGVKGVRAHVERAIAADYEQVIREVTACLSSAKARAA